MPEQSEFLRQQVGETTVVVLKTYDRAFAREALEQLDQDALRLIRKRISVCVGDEGCAAPEGDHEAETIWLELQDEAREDWNQFSYFVVREDSLNESKYLYVSADWPSAEAFAKSHIVQLDEK